MLAGGVGGALDPLGIGLALSAAVAYAAYVLVSDRLLGTTEPLVLATMLCAGAAVAFSLGGAATGSLEPGRPSALLVVGAIALVATVLPIAAFLGGVDRIGPSRATILGTVEPPLTIALSAVVFGERARSARSSVCSAASRGSCLVARLGVAAAEPSRQRSRGAA